MSSRSLVVVALLVTIAAVAALLPAGAADKPDAFPDVALAADSVPRYSMLALDSENTKVAYILFDGNVEKDYTKLYIWVPEDPKYGRPVSQSRGENGRFPTFSIPTGPRSRESLTWAMSAQKRTWTSGGTHTRVDYATGKTITTTSEKKTGTGVVNGFMLEYQLQPETGGRSGMQPLHLVLGGNVPTVTDWKELKNPFMPWKSLRFGMSFKPVYDKDTGRLTFTGSIGYSGGSCQVRSVPADTEVDLVVRPYLEEPIYSNTVTAAEAFGAGVSVDVPYGWYGFNWKLRSDLFSAASYHNYGWPYPFSRPAAQ